MKPEILSPAGDLESFKASLSAGADAVYLGGPRFSARAYASNFTLSDLKEVIDEAKKNRIKIYVTINTLIKDDELEDAYKYAIDVWNLGVDAIIIQDTGLISLLNGLHSDIELHGSTQMTIHNLEGAHLATSMGISRVVLARELSLEEIKEIADVYETEIFIQGALCISYSGKCLMSSLIGGRSGNRGRCTQSCRMSYNLLDKSNKNIKEGYLLSPKDLNTVDIIDKVLKTGAHSLKIEGRMKRYEYVYQTVKEYKNAIEEGKGSKENILQIFNREGSNTSFLEGNPGKDLMAWNSPKNTGLPLGHMIKGKVKLLRPLRLGDGVRQGDEGFIVTKIQRNGKTLTEAFQGDVVEIYPHRLKEGIEIFKTSDSLLMKNIGKSVKETMDKAYLGDISIKFQIGKKVEIKGIVKSLDGTFKSKEITVVGPIVEESENRPVSFDDLLKNLKKMGDYSFKEGNITIEENNGFMRIATLNEVRRELYDKLQNSITETNRHEEPHTKDELEEYIKNSLSKKEEINLDKNLDKNLSKNNDGKVVNKIYCLMTKKEHLNLYLEHYVGIVEPIFYPVLRQEGTLNFKDIEELDKKNITYYIKTPEILKSEFKDFINRIEKLKNLKGVLSDNLGVINYIKNRNNNKNNKLNKNINDNEELSGTEKGENKLLEILGDYKLNIFNSAAEIAFEKVSKFTVSEEMNREELFKLRKKDNKIVILYGSLEYMVSEYCPMGSVVGGRSTGKECTMPCLKEEYFLKDRLNEKYPVKSDLYCRSYILSSKPKNITHGIKELKEVGYKNFRLDFWDEDNKTMKYILDKIIKGEGADISNYTLGHYRMGVE